MAPVDRESLEKRPGIFVIGSPSVGKRTLLSRLISVNFEDSSDPSSVVLVHGWTIDTKYYTADVSIWMVHLHDGFSMEAIPACENLAALVMVFDMSDFTSLLALKEWVSRIDMEKFEILLCIGNKADLLPGHSAHAEYKRCLEKLEESWGSSNWDVLDYGISETEGSSLLGDAESSPEIKQCCLDWCFQHNIEFVEACASNSDFDKCLSVDGDLQGVERLFGALTAHMWPGMILKSGDKLIRLSLPEKQESSYEDSDFEVEYEVLSAGSAEPWDDTDIGWISANSSSITIDGTSSVSQCLVARECDSLQSSASTSQNHEENNNEVSPDGGWVAANSFSVITNETTSVAPSLVAKDCNGLQPSASTSQKHEEIDNGLMPGSHASDCAASDVDEGGHYEFEDLELLMSEIGNIRENVRFMPDFQRREMAANLAMKMAAMFGDESGEDEGS